MTTTTPVETFSIASNPFALMMDPEAVFAAMAKSDRLARLSSRICRPLDKPVATKADGASVTASDALVDAEPELDMDVDVDVEIPALLHDVVIGYDVE